MDGGIEGCWVREREDGRMREGREEDGIVGEIVGRRERGMKGGMMGWMEGRKEVGNRVCCFDRGGKKGEQGGVK